MDAWVQEQLAKAPPLTPQQIERIRQVCLDDHVRRRRKTSV